MPDLDLASKQKIAEICEVFGRSWSEHKRPDFSHFVEKIESQYREELIAQLIVIDCQLRRGMGQKVESQDYHDLGLAYGLDLEHSVVGEAAAPTLELETQSFAADSTGAPQGRSSKAEPHETVDLASRVPTSIGRYRVEGILGKGGFGTVYKAFDLLLKRHVAVKVPRGDSINRPEEAEAYLAEARMVAKLEHPNIVAVHDVGQNEEYPCYVVSRLIEGSDLSKLLHRGSLSVKESVELVATVAEALQYAHQQGLVHRDIKPSNILLASDGTPFVVDFGLALKEQEVEVGTEYAGTPAYMSPEQARGEGRMVDGRSDIYSLGVVLYELLVGRRPFKAESVDELLGKIADLEVKPIRQLAPSVPIELERICLTALCRCKSERYTTAKDFADDLRSYLNHLNMVDSSVPTIFQSKSSLRVVIGLTVLAAFISLGFVAVRLSSWNGGERGVTSPQVSETITALQEASWNDVQLLLRELDEIPRELAIGELQSRYQSSAGQEKLNLALGLAYFGKVEVGVILDGLLLARAGEQLANVLVALRSNTTESLKELKFRAAEATSSKDWDGKAKLAIVALHLGDTSIAAEMLRAFPEESDEKAAHSTGSWDPVQRTVFIRVFPDWSGAIELLVTTLEDTKNEALRSGICLGLGSVLEPEPEAKEAWKPELLKWFSDVPEGGTHSAAGWVLSRWKLPIPETETTQHPTLDRSWWHEPNGLRFVKIPAGTVAGENGIVEVQQDLWLSDTEISVGLFRAFMADNEYHRLAPELKPNWTGPHVFGGSDLPDLPVQQVNWNDAILFCNWLSWKLGMDAFYTVTKLEAGLEVGRASGGNGIRLPTDSEWEYACRCATTTRFSFGDNEDDLGNYGWYGGNSEFRTHISRGKLCSPWGLFDMHGSVYEWCWHDSNVGWSPKPGRVGKSGGFKQPAHASRSSNRVGGHPTYRQDDLGFRVAKGPLPDFSYRFKKYSKVTKEEWIRAVELHKELISRCDESRLVLLLSDLSALALAAQDYESFEYACEELLVASRAGKDPNAARKYLYSSVVHTAKDSLTSPQVEIARNLVNTNPILMRLLAATQFRAGKFEESLTCFESAHKLTSPTCWDHCFMAMAKYKTGDVAKAKELYQEAAVKAPDESWVTRIHHEVLMAEAGSLIWGAKQ